MRCVLLQLFFASLLGSLQLPALANDDAHRVLLSSATENIHRAPIEITQHDVDFPISDFVVRHEVLHGGKQEGVELITIDNGKIKICVIPTRGLSVLDVRQGDFRLGWNSPVKEIVHPQYVDLESRGGLGWLEGFNEWMVRCGLEFAGHPGTDEFITNTGATGTMDLTLHGKIGNIPASEVEVLIDRKPPHRIRLRGVVHERMFFGPKLKLTAEISTVPGSTELTIVDKVTNAGALDQEMQLIYHTNYGAPLLEEGATVLAPAKRIQPMNAEAAPGLNEFDTYGAPQAGFIEQVYLVEPWSDDAGQTSVLLRNRDKDRGASISWSTHELPYLTIWKNTVAETDGYVTGLEPATGYPFNRKVERAAGRVPKLKPGETRSFTLTFGLHSGAEAVKSAADRIQTIRDGRPMVSVREAPVIE